MAENDDPEMAQMNVIGRHMMEIGLAERLLQTPEGLRISWNEDGVTLLRRLWEILNFLHVPDDFDFEQVKLLCMMTHIQGEKRGWGADSEELPDFTR